MPKSIANANTEAQECFSQLLRASSCCTGEYFEYIMNFKKVILEMFLQFSNTSVMYLGKWLGINP